MAVEIDYQARSGVTASVSITAGSASPSVYTDSGLSSAATMPYTLSGTGAESLYVGVVGNFRVVITYSDGKRVEAASGVSNATTTLTFRPVSDENTQEDVGNLSGTYAPLTRLADQTEPYTIAHNGSSNIIPIHTMNGYDYVWSCGLPIIDMDVRILADGLLANIHDSTVDATTTATGDVSSFTAPDFRALTMDASSWLAAGYSDTSPTLVADVMAKYGKDAIYSIESKDATTASVQKIVDLVTALGLKRNTVIQSANLGSLAPAVSAGITTMFVSDSPTPSAVVAAGVTGVVILYSTASATITACIDAGLMVWAWGVSRRADHASMAALGVSGVVSEDPLYTSSRSPVLTADTFSRLTWAPGHGLAANSRGTLVAPGKLQWSVGQNASALFGFLCPVADAASSYQIDFTWTFDAVGATNTAGMFLHIGSVTDDPYKDNISGAGYTGGYKIDLLKQGTLRIHRTDAPSTITQLQAVAATALTVDGTSVAVRINVTPTSITAAIPAQSKTITATDDTYRGGFIHAGQMGLSGALQGSISGITIT